MKIILPILACVFLASCASFESPPRRQTNWLARVQNGDGSWGVEKNDKHILTSLSLLAFLALGETPLSEVYGTTVQNAMRWLASNTASIPAQTGDPNYQYLPADAIVAKALAESYSMTGIPYLKKTSEELLSRLLQEKRESLWHHEAYRAAYLSGLAAEGLEEEIKRRSKAVSMLKPSSDLGAHQVAAVALEAIAYGSTAKNKAAWAKALMERVPPVNWAEPGTEWPLITWWFTSWTLEKVGYVRGDPQRALQKKWLDSLHAAIMHQQNEDGSYDMPGNPELPSKETARFKNRADARIYVYAMLASTEWPFRRLPSFILDRISKLLEEGDGENKDESDIVIEID